MSDDEIIVDEKNNTLVISEKKNGIVTAVTRVVAGAITEAQLAYYEANLRGKTKQIEADLILKYFYGISIDENINENIRSEVKKKLDDTLAQNPLHAATAENTIILNDVVDTDIPELTPEYLTNVITPYLNAVIELQHLIDAIKGNEPSHVNIKEIKRNSPISVSLDGAGEAIQVIKDTVVPWRRKHSETMARLLEQEKLIEIEAKRAEVVDKKIIAREQANKLKLENEKLRLELQQAKMQLAFETLNSISHNLTQAEREAIVNKLLPILETLSLSKLEMATNK